MKRTHLSKIVAALLFALATASPSALAYVFTINSSGQNLYWQAPVKPVFYANWSNANSLTYSNIFNSFTNSLQRWKNIGTGTLDFDYWQGNDASATPVALSYDGRNAIFFSSQSAQKLSGGVLAVTSVISYVSSGVIVETDLEFNDESFIFTTNPADSSVTGDHAHVFLENVATHEFGHAYGLSHSASLQSSMGYLEYAAQAKPACDDTLAMGARYPKASFVSGRGSIHGAVTSAGGTSIFGAHALAISASRGTVVGTAITMANGQFTISNVEPGTYYIMIEPFQGASPIASLCGGSASGCYFGTVNSHTICASSPFKRGFIESSAGVPTVVTVTANTTTNLTTHATSCTAMTGGTAGATTGTAPTLVTLNSGAPAIEARTMVIGASGSEQYFKLEDVLGAISVKVLAYSLYAPFNPQVTLLEADGTTTVAGATANSDAFTNSSGYVNYDSNVSYTAGSTTSYYIKVRNNGALSTSAYPSGTALQQIDSTRFYILIASINQDSGLLPSAASPTIANNVRCESTDSFSAFTDHGPPTTISSTPSTSVSSSGSSSSNSSGGGGGCGWITPQKDHENGASRSTNPAAFFSTWGILFLIAALHLMQRLILAIKPNRH